MARAEAARLAEEQRVAEEATRVKAAAEEAARQAALAKKLATETLRSAMDAARERVERARGRATESGADVREMRQSTDSVSGTSGDPLAALQSAVVKADEEQVSWAWMAITSLGRANLSGL